MLGQLMGRVASQSVTKSDQATFLAKKPEVPCGARPGTNFVHLKHSEAPDPPHSANNPKNP